MRKVYLAGILLAASCGSGEAPSIAGSWREPPVVPGSFFEMTLLADGNQVAGTGVSHVEAGMDQPFAVSGTQTQLVLTFTTSGQTQTFAVAQPDHEHLNLANAAQTLSFVRQ
jgi:hypothetical protein